MTTQINQNLLKQFIIEKVGVNVKQNDAQKAGIDEKQFDEANVDENDYLDIDEILESDDILAQFTQEYVAAKNEKSAESKEEKDERLNKDRTSDKNQAQA